MAFNYLQTDDRDDYFSQFDINRTYKRYSYRKIGEKTWSGWKQKSRLIGLIKHNSNFTNQDLKNVTMQEIFNIVSNLDYEIYSEKLPYCSGYPIHCD